MLKKIKKIYEKSEKVDMETSKSVISYVQNKHQKHYKKQFEEQRTKN